MVARAIRDQSLRERYRAGGAPLRAARDVLEDYYPLLQEVFPFAGEIENIAAYDQYLRDPDLEWDIVVLQHESDQRIIGGIQWQALRGVGATIADSLAWVEHVWLRNEPRARNYAVFRALTATLFRHMQAQGIDLGFMEFNDPDKMTPAQMEEDARAGLTSAGRLRLWARMGVYELLYRDGARLLPVPYAQPSLEGGPPVAFLSLGFFSLTRDLAGERLPADDYLKILHRAHATIRGLDVTRDPTCRGYTEAIRRLPGREFELSPLARRIVGRGD